MYIILHGCLRVKIKSVLNLHCGSPPLVCMCTQHQVHYHKLHYITVEIQTPGNYSSRVLDSLAVLDELVIDTLPN